MGRDGPRLPAVGRDGMMERFPSLPALREPAIMKVRIEYCVQ